MSFVCRDTVAVMSDYADGVLAVATRADVDRHLAECPRCREFLLSLRVLPTIVARSSEVRPPVDLGQRVLETLRRARQS